jgi:hypothetical protein
VTVMTSGLLTSLKPDKIVTRVSARNTANRRRSGFQVSKTTACPRNLSSRITSPRQLFRPRN